MCAKGLPCRSLEKENGAVPLVWPLAYRNGRARTKGVALTQLLVQRRGRASPHTRRQAAAEVLRQSHPCPRSFLARATGRVSSQMSIKQEFHSCPNQNSFGNASSKSSLVQIEPRF